MPCTFLKYIYFKVVGIDFALNYLIKPKYFVMADSAQTNIHKFVF